MAFRKELTKDELIKKGIEGEKSIDVWAKFLPENYFLYRDICFTHPSRNTSTQIDAVVVCKYGIFVIEIKNWDGYLNGDHTNKKYKHIFIDYGSDSYKILNPFIQNEGHIAALSEALGVNVRKFHSIIAFVGKGRQKKEIASDERSCSNPLVIMNKLSVEELLSEFTFEQVKLKMERIQIGSPAKSSRHEKRVETVYQKRN